MQSVKSLAVSLGRSPSRVLLRRRSSHPDARAGGPAPGVHVGVAVLPEAGEGLSPGWAGKGPRVPEPRGERGGALEPAPSSECRGGEGARWGAGAGAGAGGEQGDREGRGGEAGAAVASAEAPEAHRREADSVETPEGAAASASTGGDDAVEAETGAGEAEPSGMEWREEAPPAWIDAGAALVMVRVPWEAATAAAAAAAAAATGTAAGEAADKTSSDVAREGSESAPNPASSGGLCTAFNEALRAEGLSRRDLGAGGRARIFTVRVIGRPEAQDAGDSLEELVRAGLDGCGLEYVQSLLLLRGSPRDFTLSQRATVAWAPALRTLSLQDCGLMVLPPAVLELGALEELNLARNRLQTLPGDLGLRLSRLRVLSAERNQIAQFPTSLPGLLCLQTLNLEHNRLQRLRNNFSQETPELRELLLLGNPLEVLPQIGGCVRVAGLSFGNVRIVSMAPGGEDPAQGEPLTAKVTVLPSEGLLGSVASMVSRAGGDLVLDLAFRGGDPHPIVLAAVTAIARGGKGDCEKIVHREGAVQALLLSALHSSQDLVVVQACECLQVLAAGMEDGGKELLEKGLQDSLCALLRTPDSHRCGLALPLACSLAFRGDEIPEWLVTSGIVESLLGICKNDESVENQVAALQCLGNLAFCVEARRAMLKIPGLVQALEGIATQPQNQAVAGDPEQRRLSGGRLAEKRRRKALRALASLGANEAVDRAVGRAPRHRRGVRILALDGGGLRSLATCMFLAEIEQRTGKKIYELFDLISGVSAGSFSACGLGILKYRSNQIEWICRYMGDQIFQKPVVKQVDRSNSGPVGSFLSEAVSTLVAASKQTARTAVFGTKYPVDALETYLKTYATTHGELIPPSDVTTEQMAGSFQDRSVLPGPLGPDLRSDEEDDDRYETFLDGEERGGCRVCLVSTRIDTHPHQSYVFRSYNHPEPKAAESAGGAGAGVGGGGGEGMREASRGEARAAPPALPGSCKCRMWEACRASSAAPYFLEECNLDEKRFIDGAFVSNNPSMVAMHEAQRLWPDRPVEVLVSLGTGIPATRPKGTPASNILELITILMNSACSADKVHKALQLFSPAIQGMQYFRFQVADERCDIKLDCTDPEKLEALLAAFAEYCEEHGGEFQAAADALLRAEEKDRVPGSTPRSGGAAGGLAGVLLVDSPLPGGAAATAVDAAAGPLGSQEWGGFAGVGTSASAGQLLAERMSDTLHQCPVKRWRAPRPAPEVGGGSEPQGGRGNGSQDPFALQVLRQLRELRTSGGVSALHLAGVCSGDSFVLDWSRDVLAVAEPSEEAARLLRTIQHAWGGGSGGAPGLSGGGQSLAGLCDERPTFSYPGGGTLSLKGRNAQKVGELAVTTLLFERVRPRAALCPADLQGGPPAELGAVAGAEGCARGGSTGVVVSSSCALPPALVRAFLDAGALAVVLPAESWVVPPGTDLLDFFVAFYAELHRLLAQPVEGEGADDSKQPLRRPHGQVVREALRAAAGVVPALARAFVSVTPPPPSEASPGLDVRGRLRSKTR